MIQFIFLPVLLALANRFSGGGFGWKPTFRGRPLYYATIVLALLLGAWLGWQGVMLALWFFIWRTPGWHFSFSIPSAQQFEAASIRMAFAFPMFAIIDPRMVWFAIPFSLTAALAYFAAWRTVSIKRDPTAVAEVAVGALLGVWLTIAAVVA